MEIKRNGTRPSAKGPPEHFTGNVRVDPLFQASAPARAGAAVRARLEEEAEMSDGRSPGKSVIGALALQHGPHVRAPRRAHEDPIAKRRQYSPLITKNDPRMVPASLDFCLANLKRGASSAGTSIPSESLNPTARFPLSSIVYITLIERPLS